VASGQWLVASGWWQVGGPTRKRRSYCVCAAYASFRGYGLAGMPKEARPQPVPLPQERESNGIKASAVALHALADKLAGQAESAEGLVVVRLLRFITAMPLALQQSRRIKANQGKQTKSNQIKPAGVGGSMTAKQKLGKQPNQAESRLIKVIGLS